MKLVQLTLSSPISGELVVEGQQSASQERTPSSADSLDSNDAAVDSNVSGLSSNSSSPGFISILPDSKFCSAFGFGSSSSLGSKSDPILKVKYPMPWRILAQRESILDNPTISENLGNWRRILKQVITFFLPENTKNGGFQ